MTEQQAQEVIGEHVSTVRRARKIVAAIEDHPDPLLKEAVFALLDR